jgi:hypothetical protein
MGTEMVPETSVKLTRMIARKDFINVNRRESFRSYTNNIFESTYSSSINPAYVGDTIFISAIDITGQLRTQACYYYEFQACYRLLTVVKLYNERLEQNWIRQKLTEYNLIGINCTEHNWIEFN